MRKIGHYRSSRIQWTRANRQHLWTLYLESNPRAPYCLERLWEKWCRDCPQSITTKEALSQQLRKIRDSNEFIPHSAQASVDEPEANETAKKPYSEDEIGKRLQYWYDRCVGTEGNFDGRRRVRCKGKNVPQELLQTVDAVVKTKMETSSEFWEVNCWLYAASHTVREVMGQALDDRENLRKDQKRETNLMADMAHLRGNISRISNELHRMKLGRRRTKKERRMMANLVKELGLQDVTLTTLKRVKEEKRQRLRVRQRQLAEVRKQQKREQKKGYEMHGVESLDYDTLKGMGETRAKGGKGRVPEVAQIEEYWEKLLSREAEFSTVNPYILKWREEVETKIGGETIEDMEEISMPVWSRVLKDTKSWKAPGQDALYGYWWKSLPTLHGRLRELLNEALQQKRTIPHWMVEGVTTLIPKGKERTADPKQYRPITCLNIMYKLYTSSLMEMLLHHVERFGLLPEEQKALRRGRAGCHDALLVDRMIVEDSEMRGRQLAVAWVDYSKAFDSVPHAWVKRMLKEMGVPKLVREAVCSLMPLWRSRFHVEEKDVTRPISYKRGLFQGDALSPLLFCLSLTPVSNALRGLQGYLPQYCQASISHTYFVDDLKKSMQKMIRHWMRP